jgi:hypothetical protein
MVTQSPVSPVEVKGGRRTLSIIIRICHVQSGWVKSQTSELKKISCTRDNAVKGNIFGSHIGKLELAEDLG